MNVQVILTRLSEMVTSGTIDQVVSLREDIVALQRRADFLLDVVTALSKNNNQSWTIALDLLLQKNLRPQVCLNAGAEEEKL